MPRIPWVLDTSVYIWSPDYAVSRNQVLIVDTGVCDKHYPSAYIWPLDYARSITQVPITKPWIKQEA